MGTMADKKRLTSVGNFLERLAWMNYQVYGMFLGRYESSWSTTTASRISSTLYNDQLRRHEVQPGITGWAQINGRNTISWEDKFNFDLWYIKNQSFWIDIKIIFITVLKF